MEKEVTAQVEELFKQAGTTAEAYLDWAVRAVNEQEDLEKYPPELKAQLMVACIHAQAADFNSAMAHKIAENIAESVLELIGDFARKED